MEIKNKTFEIHLTNEDPTQDAKVLAFSRYRKPPMFKKSKEGKEVKSNSLALFTSENDIIEKIKKDEDVLQEFMDKDGEIDIELAGKMVGRTATMLLKANSELCYNFSEYEIKKDRMGKIIVCEQCGEVYCDHRIKKQTTQNINEDDKPVFWIKKIMMDKLEAIKNWSFDKSYQIVHTNGLTYKFLFEMAEKLHESNKLVLMGPIIDKKPQKLVLRTGMVPFFAWLEGRIQGDKYALILHGTSLKLKDKK